MCVQYRRAPPVVYLAVVFEQRDHVTLGGVQSESSESRYRFTGRRSEPSTRRKASPDLVEARIEWTRANDQYFRSDRGSLVDQRRQASFQERRRTERDDDR